MTYCFSLAAFNILSLWFSAVWLWCVVLFVFIMLGVHLASLIPRLVSFTKFGYFGQWFLHFFCLILSFLFNDGFWYCFTALWGFIYFLSLSLSSSEWIISIDIFAPPSAFLFPHCILPGLIPTLSCHVSSFVRAMGFLRGQSSVLGQWDWGRERMKRRPSGGKHVMATL